MLLSIIIELCFQHILNHMIENCSAVVGLGHVTKLICHVEQEVSERGNGLIAFLVLAQVLLTVLDHLLDLL